MFQIPYLFFLKNPLIKGNETFLYNELYKNRVLIDCKNYEYQLQNDTFRDVPVLH